MSQLIVFIIGVIAGALSIWVWLSGKQKEAQEEIGRLKKEADKDRQEYAGLEEYNKKTSEIKEQRKQKILSEIKQNGKTDAGKVAGLLDVSRYTAFRYLEELEKQGQIKQKGAVGRGVEYILK